MSDVPVRVSISTGSPWFLTEEGTIVTVRLSVGLSNDEVTTLDVPALDLLVKERITKALGDVSLMGDPSVRVAQREHG